MFCHDTSSLVRAGRGISQSASLTNKTIGNTFKVRVKGKVVAVDTTKSHGEVLVQLHACLNLMLHAGEQTASQPGHFLRETNPGTH